ncbi:histidinol-phosphate transaminase [Silvimonas iriomotensis]|uniref:Histidinol-phosphate aminotransferase n=1 Tax=Silvimonas iriomotensis TaxID=449662 RepID=A0ABQ2PFL1_9NEIS|nr:histidinol-phosphate transaminase [Silvimonas iriomotensis]GGP24024.1 histidinol-phosphate aminotransferase 1 [Silvimonas iriomotensis]
MSRFWSPIVQTLTPYVPGEQPKIANLIKLNTNENPYGPSPRVLEAIAAESSDALRLYPDPNSDRLKQTIAHYHGIEPNEIFVGNGSDEVLAHTFMALLKHDKPLLHPDISYSFYPVYCGLYGVENKLVPLDSAMRINPADYNQDCGAIIIANPNAPTGIALTAAEVETLVQAHPDKVVVIDEAYIDFGGETVIPLIKRYPNLLVIQTLSKSRSLAGLRIGFAAGHPDLIEGLERVKNSFNSYPLDRIAIAAGVAAYEDETYFQRTVQAVIDTRTNLVAGLTLLGFEVLPSATNFVFARHPRHDAAKLATDLRAKAILVRHFKQARIDQYLRISIGTDEQCEALVNALQALIAA